MADKPLVEINRTCLSLLLRDNAASPGDQEGFLVGEVIQRPKKISDTQERAGTLDVIRVIATFPLAKHCRFYNAVGRIDVEALRRILGPFAEKIVGYYDFKRNMDPAMETSITFTQKNVFKGLCQYKELLTKDPLILMQLRQSHDSKPNKYYDNSKNIIINSYCFLSLSGNGSFVKLASSIPNLGDTSHDRYVQNTTVPQVDKLFEKMKSPTLNIDALLVVKIHKSVMDQLKKSALQAAELEQKFQNSASSLSQTEREIAAERAICRELGQEAFEKAMQDIASTSKSATSSMDLNVKQLSDHVEISKEARLKRKH